MLGGLPHRLILLRISGRFGHEARVGSGTQTVERCTAKLGNTLAIMKTIGLTRRAARVAAPLLCSAVLLGACSPPSPAPEATQARTDVPSSGPGDNRAQVTAAYERFWSTTIPLASRPPEESEPQLQKVAVDPQLIQLAEGYRALRDRNLTLYGQVVPRVTAAEVTGDEARVTDCQDASQSGQADATTGQRKTVGVARTPVSARLVRDGGEWKVARITYPGGDC